MRKGFTKAERKKIENHIDKIDDALEKLAELLREKHQKAEEWIEERSEQWFDSDNGQEFEDWANELDFKIDEIENLRCEIDIDSFEEVLYESDLQ